MEEGDLMNHIFFGIAWIAGLRHLPQEHLAQECTMRRSWQRQCDALGKPWEWHEHLPKHCCHVDVFMEMVFPDGRCLFQQKTYPASKQKQFMNCLRSTTTTSLRCWLGLQIPQIPSRASVGCAGQASPIHGGPTTNLTGLKGSVANILVQIPQPACRGVVDSVPRQVGAVLAAEAGTNTIFCTWS